MTPGVNMVSCDGWTPSLSMPVTTDFVQGDYVLKLVGAGGEQSYVPLTVWDPASTGTYLFETHSLTAQGWNSYGGFDFYLGSGACAPSRPEVPAVQPSPDRVVRPPVRRRTRHRRLPLQRVSAAAVHGGSTGWTSATSRTSPWTPTPSS